MSLVQELYRRLGNIFFEIDRFFPALVRNQSILEEQKNTKQYKNDDIRFVWQTYSWIHFSICFRCLQMFLISRNAHKKPLNVLKVRLL